MTQAASSGHYRPSFLCLGALVHLTALYSFVIRAIIFYCILLLGGVVMEAFVFSRESRKRVKKKRKGTRLPYNPPPLKALQKDVTCVR